MERGAQRMERKEVKPEADGFVLPVDSLVLERLIREVEDEPAPISSGYNRTYNRHNR